jgi:hypothetical protein
MDGRQGTAGREGLECLGIIMSSHPAIVVYGQTTEYDFPLILAFGREPNSNHYKSKGVGAYDFDNSKLCAFWNIAYRTVGSAASNSISTANLKHICRGAKSSPIAFADALPIGLKDKEKSKYARRVDITDDDIKEHISEIFSHSSITARTAIILLSGLDRPDFDRSLKMIERESLAKKIPSVRLPFFYGTNVRKIEEAARISGVASVQKTIDHFVELFDN